MRDDNGERLCDFCQMPGPVITGSFFKHKNIHKLTCMSQDKRTRNQIDHLLAQRSMKTSILDTRVCRGADVNSDNYLVGAKIRLKLRRFLIEIK